MVDVAADSSCEAEQQPSPGGRVVGIGASAGGLESLEQLFSALPADTGMAFVVVQHLSPDFRSLMDELLSRYSTMPVAMAEHGMAVEPDHIYLMPARKEMIIRDRRLWLTDKALQTLSLPIDAFFRSLAQDCGKDAVAVVLSGSGSDGSRGIVEVKHNGGVVMAESATSAKFDGMPASAAATGVVDHVHPPRDLSRVLCGLPPQEPAAADPMLLSGDPAMDAALRLLRDNFGIDFSLYKMTTVSRRIQRRVEFLRLGTLAEYVEQLAADPDELNKLYQDLLIGVTQFFRDPEAFDALEEEVIPKLLDQLKPDEELRIWTAGCATGEEAYSIAMLFWEAFKARGRAMKLKILATDVHQRSLDYASTGIYGDDQLSHVKPERLERFFVKRASGYQVSQDLRQLIVFARHNVLKDAPFTKMHFISCRNMLIYLQPAAQRTVLSLFHFGLAAGGVLFLGASESPGAISDEFTVINDHWKVYQKRRDVLLTHMRLPIMRATPLQSVPVPLPRGGNDPHLLATYDHLLDMFMPPAMLLDDERAVVDTYAGAQKLLTLKPRRPTRDVLEMLDDELRTVVAAALQRAVKERTPVSYSGVRVRSEDGEKRCVLTAHPITNARTNALNVLLVFQEMTTEDHRLHPVDPTVTSTPVTLSEASQERISTLETELQFTRETLQATIEELETSNEEMQATNEELIASNEELQSTNEELHSVNEELYTVNAEYQQRILELKELNADMAHLLDGTDVGTVFLDHELRIRRFTTRIASVFRIQQRDIGRRIDDFSHNIERPGLMDEIKSVLERGQLVQEEVRDRSGTPYFLRILPYRIHHHAAASADAPAPIDGVVLMLTDMSALDQERRRAEELSALVEWSDDAIFGQDIDGKITTWNRGAEALYGYRADEVRGKSAALLLRPGTENDHDSCLHQIEEGDKVSDASHLCRRKDGTILDVSVTMSPILDRGRVSGAAVIARDITNLVTTQRELEGERRHVRSLLEASEEASQRRDEFLAMLSHELRNPLAAVMSATTAIREHGTIETIKKCQAVIERQAGHMKRLLEDLLDVSRITTDKFILSTERVDLREAIELAKEATAPKFTERGVKFDCVMPARPLSTRGDSRRLTQVFANLLANAATYSPQGNTVRLTVTATGNAATIVVHDEGEGIALDLQPKIFELFVQSEQKLDRPRGGLGVGLSLAKTIVEMHGGTIEVHSDGQDKGSEFTVTLPLCKSTHAILSQGVPGGPCKIVLVDDQEDSRDMLRVLFESRDHLVFDASDGVGAVQLIAQKRPDVAFIDIGLPVMNGFEVAQQIRKRPELDNVMLVALSGYGNKSDVEAALSAGFDAHVTKPAEFKKLEEILARKRPHTDDE